ncbi:MAG: ATP-binding cassette domain-containing protein [Coprobacillus cateniformis]
MDVAHAMDRLPSKVSGGEAQRAAIARAIINDPKMLFADEPTGALNRRNSDEVLSILQKLHEQGQSILMVTHDMHAAAYGTRILYMEDGKILAEMKLASMIKDDLKEREARIHEWLTSLNW